MTDKTIKELIEAQSRALSLEFKQLLGEPFRPHKERPVMAMHSAAYLRSMTERQIKQSECRMYRVSVIPYKIEVLNDDDDDDGGTIYTIHAASALDARCMAFVLDGGCEAGLKHWDDGHIELAITYTKVVE